MSYTVTKLITRAYYLSQVVSRRLQTVDGDQISDGLDLLNALLSFKSSDSGLIPYYTNFEFNAIADQEEYYIPNLIEVESLTFNLGPIRYSMMELDRKRYFGSSRIDNITSLPYSYRCERTLDGMNIFLYFLPDQAYVMKLIGRFGLMNVSLNQDLLLTYDAFYIEYLRYSLAQMICNEYGIEMLPNVLNMLRSYETRLRATSPADLTMQKLSTFAVQPGLMYADANLGKGWRP